MVSGTTDTCVGAIAFNTALARIANVAYNDIYNMVLKKYRDCSIQ